MTSKERKVSPARPARLGLAGKLVLAQLALATCITTTAAPVAALEGGARVSSFHTRVQAEMESVLGAPIRTHQDAINAAYLSVGWTWGADTPDAMDDAAYRRAWRWGFRIEEFAQTRDERFSLTDLADASLRGWEGADLARAEASAPAQRDTQEAPQVFVATARGEEEAPDLGRIAAVERRVLAAQEEIARISADIDSLERRAQDADGSAGEQQARKAELAALNRSLEASQAALVSLHGELRAVSDGLTGN